MVRSKTSQAQHAGFGICFCTKIGGMMKLFVRDRSKDYGDPNSLLPYQAVLWFKPEGSEPWQDAQREAIRFLLYLRHQLLWSSGALGRAPGIVDTRWRGNSTGILFNHKNFAREAKSLYKEWRENENPNPHH